MSFLQKDKLRSDAGVLQKQSRLQALYKTSLHIWRFQGFFALIKHTFSFLKGERQNSKLVFPHNSTTAVALKEKNKIYAHWIQRNEPDQAALESQKSQEKQFQYKPLISILTPVYNADEILLKKMIDSVVEQTYSNWELCLVDGNSAKSNVRQTLEQYSDQNARIKVKFLDENLGISGNSNEALKMAEGEFAVLLDHDDELSPDALYENVLLLNQHPDAEMIYSDEDKFDDKDLRCEPHFKPDWSPDFFRSTMYTSRLGIYRTALIKKIGGFRSGFGEARDWDLVLRVSEQTEKIYHIPKILYHRRQIYDSTALSSESKDYLRNARIKAVAEHLKRLNIKAEVSQGMADNLLRVKRALFAQPKVSIIIPTRDQIKLLQNCIDSIGKLSTYQNYEIIVVDNNSLETKTLDYFKVISKEPNVRVIEYRHPFNFAAINNFAAESANGELLLFLNNDIEVISHDWLEAMIEHAVRPEIGAVGARLLYPDGTVQHAGIITGIGGVAGHSHKYIASEDSGYFSRAKAIQNVSAVTGACLMVRKDVFKSLGGFNEKDLAIAFNDVDFCLRIRRKGLLIIYTPYAELYHHESLSRGSDYQPETIRRFQAERNFMLNTWKESLLYDPYYNPNLTLEKEDFSIKETSDGGKL